MISKSLQFIQLKLKDGRNQQYILCGMIFLVAMSVLYAVAFTIYSLFYFSYIPSLIQESPLYLNYDSHLPKGQVECSQLKLFDDQQYNFIVTLDVPDSNHNVQIGNFMIHFAITNDANKTLLSSSRPGLLKYKSPLLKAMTTFWNLFSIVFGYYSETQSIAVTVLERVKLPQNTRPRLAHISISNPNLHIHSAKLGVQTCLRGLRFYMYEWYFTMALFMSTLILLWEITFILYGFKFLSSFDYSSLWRLALDEKQSHSQSQSSTGSSAHPSITLESQDSPDFIPDTFYKEQTSPSPTNTTMDGHVDEHVDELVNTQFNTHVNDENNQDQVKMESQNNNTWTSLFHTRHVSNAQESVLQEKSLNRMSSYQYDIPPNMNPYSYTYIPEFTEFQYMEEMELRHEPSTKTEKELEELPSDGIYSSTHLDLSLQVDSWRQNVEHQDFIISHSFEPEPQPSLSLVNQELGSLKKGKSGLTRRHSFINKSS